MTSMRYLVCALAWLIAPSAVFAQRTTAPNGLPTAIAANRLPRVAITSQDADARRHVRRLPRTDKPGQTRLTRNDVRHVAHHQPAACSSTGARSGARRAGRPGAGWCDGPFRCEGRRNLSRGSGRSVGAGRCEQSADSSGAGTRHRISNRLRSGAVALGPFAARRHRLQQARRANPGHAGTP